MIDINNSKIEIMKKIANNRGGKLISYEIKGSRFKYSFICAKKHEFECTYFNLNNGRWCKQCNNFGSSIGERITREIFERIFQKQFKKVRPIFLEGLELDGYCEELKIAFEYNGVQHYDEDNVIFGRKSYEKIKQNDYDKKLICEEMNINLVVIKQFKEYGNLKECIKQIEQSILSKGIKIPYWEKPEKIDNIYKPMESIFGQKKSDDIKSIINDKGGIILNDNIIKSHDGIEIKCDKNHTFKTRAQDILSGIWCRFCSPNSTQNIKDMQVLAETKGGKFLSKEYVNSQTKHKWQCSKEHTWEARPSQIRRGTWCPTCAGRTKTIDDMQILAKNKEGKCLSEKYLGDSKKHLWECSCGHVWNAVPTSIIQGNWCPPCGRKKATEKRLQTIKDKKSTKLFW